MDKLVVNLRPQPQPNTKLLGSIVSLHCLMESAGLGWTEIQRMEYKTLHFLQQSVLLLPHCLDVSAGLGYVYYIHNLEMVNDYGQ